MPVFPVTTPEVATVADAVVTDVAVVTTDDVATPTGYIPMLCVVSPSPVVDDTVEVPELGDGCLKTKEKCYLRAGFMEEVVVKDEIYAFHCYRIEINIDIPRRFLRKKITI